MDGKRKVGLVLTVLLGIFFIVMQGLGKLAGDTTQLAEDFGYSPTFMKLIGGLELLGGVGLFLPQTRKLAALGLIGLMLGAIVSHVQNPAQLNWIYVPILTAIALGVLLKLQGGDAAPAVGD